VKTGETMRSASRLLHVLSSFTLDKPAKTITEISRELGLSASTIRRLLLTLESQGFVRLDPETARYHLHYEIIRLAAVASETSSLIDVSLSAMDELRGKTEETVQLAVRNGSDVVFIANRDSPLGVRIFHPVGWRHAAYLGSAPGKVLLAWLDEEELGELLPEGPWSATTQRTITDPEAFREHLATVRAAGHATNDGEMEDGIWGTAAPIRDHRGEIVAAINLPCPLMRAPVERRAELISATVETADRISTALRFRPGQRSPASG
jgi:DNA-binding IclR family transcriptional regulator